MYISKYSTFSENQVPRNITSICDYFVKTTGYSLPKDLHAHIDVIQPTGRFKNDSSTLVWLEDEIDTNEFCPVLLYQSTPSVFFAQN